RPSYGRPAVSRAKLFFSGFQSCCQRVPVLGNSRLVFPHDISAVTPRPRLVQKRAPSVKILFIVSSSYVFQSALRDSSANKRSYFLMILRWISNVVFVA